MVVRERLRRLFYTGTGLPHAPRATARQAGDATASPRRKPLQRRGVDGGCPVTEQLGPSWLGCPRPLRPTFPTHPGLWLDRQWPPPFLASTDAPTMLPRLTRPFRSTHRKNRPSGSTARERDGGFSNSFGCANRVARMFRTEVRSISLTSQNLLRCPWRGKRGAPIPVDSVTLRVFGLHAKKFPASWAWALPLYWQGPSGRAPRPP